MNDRPTHPLKAWRLTQRVYDEKRKCKRQMTIADAAAAIGENYHAWKGWERYPDEKGGRIPLPDNMRKIIALTGGQVRPDHFYDLRTLRAQREAEALQGHAHG